MSARSADGAAVLPCAIIAECLYSTLTPDPDIPLLELSYPNEQDAAFAAPRTSAALDGV